MALRRQGVALVFATLFSLGASFTSAAPQDCSILGENTFVRDTLEDQYLWYRQLKPVDPASALSPEAYLDAVRYKPLDAGFSYISDQSSDTSFFSDSQYVGLGVVTQLVGQSLRVSDVYEASPAAVSGLVRGYEILSVNGQAVGQLIQSGSVGSAFGPADVGFLVEVTYRDETGALHAARMTKAVVTIPTVSAVKVFDLGAEKAGYLLFRSFVAPADAALDQAFARLRSEGVSRLVLDLRYNGGGLVSVAQHLASLVGAPRLAGKVMVQFIHNDKHPDLDTVWRFENEPQGLGLSSIVVIATRETASASEVVINALRPFMTVTVVGDRTQGKPVGEDGFDFCDKVLHPVVFAEENALDDGSYFEGLPADCPARDDLDHALGDPAEASLAEALRFVAKGACGGAAAASDANAPRARATGFGRPVGAY